MHDFLLPKVPALSCCLFHEVGEMTLSHFTFPETTGLSTVFPPSHWGEMHSVQGTLSGPEGISH